MRKPKTTLEIDLPKLLEAKTLLLDMMLDTYAAVGFEAYAAMLTALSKAINISSEALNEMPPRKLPFLQIIEHKGVLSVNFDPHNLADFMRVVDARGIDIGDKPIHFGKWNVTFDEQGATVYTVRSED